MRMATRQPRVGYTLMEVLLVMTIIIIASAVSIPVIRSMLTDAGIHASADQVRGLAAEARARAMEDGVPWRLAYMPNTSFYMYAPEDSTEWESTNNLGVVQKIDAIRGELPKDIIFAETHEAIFGQTTPLPQGMGWQTIAVFEANGSARDDSTTYFGKCGVAPMRLVLRGLTGSATVEEFATRGTP